MLNVLVYGWYGKGIKNIGDLLFCKSFEYLFPDFNFNYTDILKLSDINSADAIIIGGGSFLYAPINIGKDEDITNIIKGLKSKKVFYVGVGIETDIHSTHKDIISSAALVATRTPGETNKVYAFANTTTIEIPDIVFSLASKFKLAPAKPKSILVLPNAELLPRWNDIQWKHAAWNYFKSEFAQFLDALKESGYSISFAAMCRNGNMHDLGAATEIINYMRSRNFASQITDFTEDIVKLSQTISEYELIISQRYHGVILSQICRRQCIAVAHHDKLRNLNNSVPTLSYYGLSKELLFNTFEQAKKSEILPIKLDTFEPLRKYIYSTVGIQCPNLLV